MEINNWIQFALYSAFTLGILFVLVPMGVNFTIAGVRCFRKYGFRKFPEGTIVSRFGKSSAELLLVGLISLGGSAWYLFYDSGGHIFRYPKEAMEFLLK